MVLLVFLDDRVLLTSNQLRRIQRREDFGLLAFSCGSVPLTNQLRRIQRQDFGSLGFPFSSN